MASTFDPVTFGAEVAALIAHEAAVLTPAQLSQIEGIGQSTVAAVQSDVAMNKDPIPDVVSGLNQIDAIIRATPPCYVTGTRIATLQGEIAVENLKVGDHALTVTGDARPIRWLGSRLTHCRRHPNPHEVMPVRIAAHAFGERRPARDLLVSPGHSLCVDVAGEVLIPAASLINGTTIRQEDMDTVTYWHVELDSHDVILAENMPAESYLDMSNRSFFADGDVIDLDALPDAPVATHDEFCRPFHAEGTLVDAVRTQLVARARRMGWRLEAQGLGDTHLVVDGLRIAPLVRDLELSFLVPAGAKVVWLVSGTASPREVSASADERQLGVCIERLVIDGDVSTPCEVPADDERLCVGFYPCEGSWRWTNGRALLPNELWAGAGDAFRLRADLHCPPVARWAAPAVAPTGVRASLSLVA